MVPRPLHLLTIGVLVVAGTFAFPATTSAAGAPFLPENVKQIWQNRVTGYCLGVAGGRMVSGTPIIVWPCNGNPDQEWITIQNPDPARNQLPGVFSGWRHMVNAADQTKCLAVAADSQDNGARLIIWPCLPWATPPGYRGGQEFWFGAGQLPGYGFYTIGAAHWGTSCVGVAGASTAKGASVIQWTCLAGHGDQEWYPSVRPIQ